MKPVLPLQAVLLLLCAAAPCFGQDRALLFAKAAAAKVSEGPTVRGDDPEWFFPTREVRHLATGRFWERRWEEVAANRSDPLPGIIEFHGLLRERGVELVVVPVPAKASIYPEAFVAGFEPGEVAALAPFLARLEAAGVEAIDLEPVFLDRRRNDSGNLLYCRRDAHFSPAAAAIVATLVADRHPIQAPASGAEFRLGEEEALVFVGDQIVGTEREGVVPPETLPVRYVESAGKVGVEPDPASPVLLLGDSHALVFHEGREGGMHCAGAGVLDQLALRYGFAPDLVGVRGSGLVQARKQLFYKASASPGYWDSKRLVVWLFSVRELTQSTDRPVPVPLSR
jgi:alginate O-acetyltransferase complex protein AlgJ